jgi:hypothetical protein
MPAGYLIVQEAEAARNSNSYFRNFGRYYGVDRLPPFIAPDPAIREMLQEPPITDVRLSEALEEWFDFRSGLTAFIPSHNEAFRLLTTFQSFDFRLELVYCQMAWREGEEERLKAYSPVEGDPPVISMTYGFDVSWPGCNHSAIFQPGIVPTTPSWREKLNERGLLDDYKDAARLRDEYLVVYPCPPFDIFLVLHFLKKANMRRALADPV